ncbi:hypothetical protein Scep_004687 [Stephania cephalantha]|uniref:Uncharacterized protein n=1 Tax=Stephania cephalantha TaxID=152367 RepID=A0AAP0KSW6_9MAGN
MSESRVETPRSGEEREREGRRRGARGGTATVAPGADPAAVDLPGDSPARRRDVDGKAAADASNAGVVPARGSAADGGGASAGRQHRRRSSGGRLEQ